MVTRAEWRSEWLIVRRHPLVWVVIAAALALIASAAGNEAPRDSRALQESLLRINLFIPAFVLPFAAGALAPVFFLREQEHRMHEIFAAYPQTRQGWLALRLGFMAATLFALCTAQQIVTLVLLSSDYPSQLAALTGRSLALMGWVHLPACLIWSCFLALISSKSGKSGITYFAAGLGWAAYLGLATLSGTPLIAGSFVAWEPLRQALLLADPYAITALVNPPPIAGWAASREVAIVLGRLVWLGLCLAALRGTLRGAARNWDDPSIAEQPRRQSAWRQAGAGPLTLLMRWSLTDKFLLLALGGWALLVFPEVFSGMRFVEQFAVTDPDSRDALNRVIWDLVPVLGALVLLYEADRVSRMTSATGSADLIAATPIASWRLLVAQLACLWLVAALLLGYTLLIVLAAQLAAQSPVDLGEYLQQGMLVLPGLLLAAAAFLAVHSAVRSRMAANLIALAIVLVGHSSLAAGAGLRHPLWKALAIPLEAPDHVLGLSANWSVLAVYGPFWAALCCGLFLLGIALHHRGTPYRQAAVRQVVRHPALPIAVVALIAAGWQGTMIDRMLKADFALVSADDRAFRRAAYERAYASWLGRPQPEISLIRAQADFAEDGRSVALRAEMTLINRSASAIDRILVGRGQIDLEGQVRLAGSHAEARDQAAGQTVFRLSSPMLPGETRVLQFSSLIARSALTGGDGLMIMQPGFASLPVSQVLPVIGFKREFTLRDPARRRQFGLPELELQPPSRIVAGRRSTASRQARFETIVSVGKGQTGLAPGELIRKWSDNSRDYFAFRTDRPIHAMAMFMALPWAPQHSAVGALRLETYAPSAVRSDNPNLLGVRDTLGWLNRDVAPYPGTTLRLIAAPEFGSSGFAFAQGILISHRRGFRARPAQGAGFDQAYRRAVHETAHQWFGHLLGNGILEERAFLVESLAKYAELVMMERRYGKEAMWALVDWEADRLAHARLVPAEASSPLIDAEDSEDMYSRATLAFACLRTRIGDKAITAALHEVADTTLRTQQAIRSVDFVAALKRSAKPGDWPVIDLLLVSATPIDAATAQAGCARDT